MSDLEQAIKTTRKNLSFHRRMVAVYFILLILVAGAYVSVEIVNESESKKMALIIIKALKGMPKNINVNIESPEALQKLFPDQVEISASALEEFSKTNVFVSLPMLSVTIFLIFAIYGLLRHHLRRINVAEDRLFLLEKTIPFMTGDPQHSKIVANLFEQSSDSENTAQDVPHLNISHDIFEKSVDAITDIYKATFTKK